MALIRIGRPRGRSIRSRFADRLAQLVDLLTKRARSARRVEVQLFWSRMALCMGPVVKEFTMIRRWDLCFTITMLILVLGTRMDRRGSASTRSIFRVDGRSCKSFERFEFKDDLRVYVWYKSRNCLTFFAGFWPAAVQPQGVQLLLTSLRSLRHIPLNTLPRRLDSMYRRKWIITLPVAPHILHCTL